MYSGHEQLAEIYIWVFDTLPWSLEIIASAEGVAIEKTFLISILGIWIYQCPLTQF